MNSTRHFSAASFRNQIFIFKRTLGQKINKRHKTMHLSSIVERDVVKFTSAPFFKAFFLFFGCVFFSFEEKMAHACQHDSGRKITSPLSLTHFYSPLYVTLFYYYFLCQHFIFFECVISSPHTHALLTQSTLTKCKEKRNTCKRRVPMLEKDFGTFFFSSFFFSCHVMFF